jgi:hypothetical protein
MIELVLGRPVGKSIWGYAYIRVTRQNFALQPCKAKQRGRQMKFCICWMMKETID